MLPDAVLLSLNQFIERIPKDFGWIQI